MSEDKEQEEYGYSDVDAIEAAYYALQAIDGLNQMTGDDGEYVKTIRQDALFVMQESLKRIRGAYGG